MGIIVPPLMARVKDRGNLPVKIAAERALMHALQVHKDPNVLSQYTSSVSAEVNRFHKHILQKGFN